MGSPLATPRAFHATTPASVNVDSASADHEARKRPSLKRSISTTDDDSDTVDESTHCPTSTRSMSPLKNKHRDKKTRREDSTSEDDISRDEESDDTLQASLFFTFKKSGLSMIVSAAPKIKASSHVATERRTKIKEPRQPTDRKHVTEHYARYDPQLHPCSSLKIPKFIPKSFSYKAFDKCPLYMDVTSSSATGDWDPPLGVRLDDWNCGEAILRIKMKKTLHGRFPAEFDVKGMLRATRNPLGNARKIYVTRGMRDGDSKVAKAKDEGYYYAWFHGLQPLMGKEGWDAARYMIRPSHEAKRSEALTWFLHSKCEVQLPVGHPDDPTFLPHSSAARSISVKRLHQSSHQLVRAGASRVSVTSASSSTPKTSQEGQTRHTPNPAKW